MHSNHGNFDCPSCKIKMNNLKDAKYLPTSRIVLQLLENEFFNYQGHASCPECRKIRNLEVCFECNLPLCSHCIIKHFDQWKVKVNQQCAINEESLKNYLQYIDQINPYIAKNFESVASITSEIEETFRALFHRLNADKESLLLSVNEFRDENLKFIRCKKDINDLIVSFNRFRESNKK